MSSDETAARAPSEAFPAIPKAAMQKRSDANHRPFRPSPLSGKTSLSPRASAEEAKEERPPSVPLNLNEEKPKTIEEEPPRPIEFPIKSKTDSESENEKKKASADEKAPDEPDDEIAALSRAVDARMAELNKLEKRLLETEQNAKKLLGVLDAKFKVEFNETGRQELKDLRQKVFIRMGEMNTILTRTKDLRDRAIETETTSLVEKHVTEAEDLLQRIEALANDIDLKRSTSTAWWIKSIAIWVLSTIGALAFLLVILLVFTEEDEIQWIRIPVKKMANELFTLIFDTRRPQSNS